MEITPLAFILVHLGFLIGLIVWAALSARQARTEPWQYRKTQYRRLTDDEVLRRLSEKGKWQG